MEYELYHDESKEGGYWHGMLLVPVNTKELLVEYLRTVRENTAYHGEISLKKVKKSSGKVYTCAQSWLQVGVAALIQNRKGKAYQLYLGRREKGQKQYECLQNLIQAKFILFRERDNFRRMTGHADYASKVETTFRMGLKGGLHLLGNNSDPIEIGKFHFDGHEHYQRHLDHHRILGRLNGLRAYCRINDVPDSFDDRSSNHIKTDSQPYEDCQLLQLTDLLVGSFRTVLCQATREIHKAFVLPVRHLVEKYRQGASRMRHSRWQGSFCSSQCYVEDDDWQFDTIEYAPVPKDQQQTLF